METGLYVRLVNEGRSKTYISLKDFFGLSVVAIVNQNENESGSGEYDRTL